MSIIELFKKVLRSGLAPNQTFIDKKEVIFVNKASLALSFVGLIVVVLGLTFHAYAQVLFAFLIFLLSPIAVLSQRLGKYNLAKFLLYTIPTVSDILCTLTYGANGNLHFYLITLMALGMTLFKSKKLMTFIFFFHTGLFTYFEISRSAYVPFVSMPDSEIHNLSNIIVMSFSIWIMLYEFRNLDQQFEVKINHFTNSLKNQSTLLTEQKIQIEKQAADLKKANLILQKEAVEKEEARKRLLASNEDLKQYASIVSHDLKEPLRTVGSFTQLIHRRHEKDYDETTREYVGFVVDAVSRMSRLLDDLLTFSRLNHRLDFEYIDLTEILTVAKHDLRHQFKTAKGEISWANMPTLYISQQQFKRLFQNLISNALKFRRENIPPSIKIEYNETENEHLFHVHDNGIGIPHEYHEKIFTLFQRLHARGEYEGSGVGLSICRKVVHNHGGEIWLEPSEGFGTTIGFSIPKKELQDNKNESKKMLMAV